MPTPACYKGKVSLISRWEESSMLICNGYAHAHSHNSGTTLPYCAMITVVTARRWLHSLWLVSLCINVYFSLCCVCRYRLSLCVWLRFVISVAVLNVQISCTLYFWTKLPPASCTLGALALHTSCCLWHFFFRQQRFVLFTKASVTLRAVLLVLTFPGCMQPQEHR